MFKKKKLKIILSFVLCGFVLTSCGLFSKKDNTQKSGAKTDYEQIHFNLLNLKSYKAEASVKYISNKNENEVDTLQHVKSSGEYRIEVISQNENAGSVTIFNGEKVLQFNPKIGGEIYVSKTESKDRLEILLTSFVKNYLESEEVSVSVSKIDSSKCTVLEATIPGTHPYISSEKLWVDNETKKPVKLVIYDPQGSERIIVNYKNFEYNVKLEESLFSVNK